MPVLKTLFYTLFLVLLSFGASAQNTEIPVGTWRTHLSYHRAQSLAASREGLYCASENGLFYLETESNSIQRLDKNDGLTGTKARALAWQEDLQTLFIAYENGNIDLYRPTETVNVQSLLNQNNITDKRSFSATLLGEEVFLCGMYGVIRLNLRSGLVRESYLSLGGNGERVPAYAVAFRDNKIYVATQQGLRYASLQDGVVREDFNNWTLQEGTVRQDVRAVAASASGNLFWASVAGQLYFMPAGQNTPQSSSTSLQVNHIFADEDGSALLSTSEGIYRWDGQNAPEMLPSDAPLLPRQVMRHQGDIWLADNGNGLCKLSNGQRTSYFPSGTYSPDAAALTFGDGKIVVAAGGYDENYLAQNSTKGFYAFQEGEWENFNDENLLDAAKAIGLNMRDFADVTYAPTEKAFYFASFGDGVLRWSPEEERFTKIDSANSPLTNNQITSVHADGQGRLWVSCYGTNSGDPVVFLREGGQWQGFDFNFLSGQFPVEIITDRQGQAWVRFNPRFGGGLAVLSAGGGKRLLSAEPDDGDLGSQRVECYALDRQGYLWVGTDEGVKVFTRTAEVLQGGDVNASDVFFNNRRLLQEKVTAIAVDGGDRKWFGTESGLWLFSDNADILYHHFTEENSPLLSNNIKELEIYPSTGELFVATDAGLLSYRSTATEAPNVVSEVHIFPNPVRPNFTGLITIDGLAENSTVKITDINGRLMFETQSFGGRATWDGTNYNGVKARPGVYLVLSANEEGEETLVGKVAVLR